MKRMNFFCLTVLASLISLNSLYAEDDIPPTDTKQTTNPISPEHNTANQSADTASATTPNVKSTPNINTESVSINQAIDIYSDIKNKFGENHISYQEADLVNILSVIKAKVIECRADQTVNRHEVFTTVRKLVPTDTWSSGELFELIDDAMELKHKYPWILEFTIRSEYAKIAIKEQVEELESLVQIASSEFIYLPLFVFSDNIDEIKFDELLTDLGCGVVWKDRLKYLYAYGTIKNYKFKGIEKCPKRVQSYFKLLNTVDGFYKSSHKHIMYRMAQDFFYDDIPADKIKKIFSFTDEEWEQLVKPKYTD